MLSETTYSYNRVPSKKHKLYLHRLRKLSNYVMHAMPAGRSAAANYTTTVSSMLRLQQTAAANYSTTVSSMLRLQQTAQIMIVQANSSIGRSFRPSVSSVAKFGTALPRDLSHLASLTTAIASPLLAIPIVGNNNPPRLGLLSSD